MTKLSVKQYIEIVFKFESECVCVRVCRGRGGALEDKKNSTNKHSFDVAKVKSLKQQILGNQTGSVNSS